MSQNNSTDNYAVANFIVSATAGQGNYTTIASAITAASAGSTIFIKPGTYKESLTLKTGVNLAAFDCDALTPNVTISGKCTYTSAGTVSISGINLQTDSDFCLAVTGASASVVKLTQCYIECLNNIGISFTSSSASSVILMTQCAGNLETTGIAYYSMSAAGSLSINYSILSNTANSTVGSTNSAGAVYLINSTLNNHPVSVSSTGICWTQNSIIYSHVINTTSFTTSGTGASVIENCILTAGTASSISIGTGTTCTVTNSLISSSNTNAVTGLGTLNYSDLTFNGVSSTINTSIVVQFPNGLPFSIGNGGTGVSSYTQSNGILTYNGTSLVNYSGPQISSSSVMTNTLQPCFLATQAATQSNATGDGTPVTAQFTTEVFDQASNYDGTSIFTAPVTGKYRFSAAIYMNGLTSSHTDGIISFVTSNRTYSSPIMNYAAVRQTANDLGLNCSILADMDAADTCFVQVTVSSGTKVVGLGGNVSFQYFSGELVC